VLKKTGTGYDLFFSIFNGQISTTYLKDDSREFDYFYEHVMAITHLTSLCASPKLY
jgi:hypothetical protein